MSNPARAPGGDRSGDRFDLVGTTLEGRFRVESRVAEGGFAVLYRGTDLALARPVAVKVLKALGDLAGDAHRAFMERFALEARTIAALDHPGIVQVLGHSVSRMPSGDVAPWMVLEWLHGETLENYLARLGRPLSPRDALALLRPAFEALAYAHDARIAHRDVKPENIMLVQPSPDRTVGARARGPLRLLDFGIAKVMNEGEDAAGSGATQTRTSTLAFSPGYAAPEQVSNLRTGPWTDVHALGLILTEALTARPPYDAGDMVSLLAEVLTEPRPTPARFGVDVGAWEPIIARAVAIKPDRRFATAREFLAALEAARPPAEARLLTTRARTGSLDRAADLTLTTSHPPAVALDLRPSHAGRAAPRAARARPLGRAAGAALVVVAAGVAAGAFYRPGADAGTGRAGATSASHAAAAAVRAAVESALSAPRGDIAPPPPPPPPRDALAATAVAPAATPASAPAGRVADPHRAARAARHASRDGGLPAPSAARTAVGRRAGRD